jgi:phosphoribosylamine-glycine ligase
LALVGEDRARLYEAARRVRFEGKQYRTDIGLEVAAAAAR